MAGKLGGLHKKNGEGDGGKGTEIKKRRERDR